MNDIIYDYPKSSCCNDVQCKCKNRCGIPTNLGVYNCDTKCYNEVFKLGDEPRVKCGFTYLNPQVYMNKNACDFTYENCETFKSQDPRLIDVPRAFKMNLDRPPMDSSIKLSQIYSDPTLCNYGKNYRTYSDIDGGQIAYYTDDYFSDTFFHPIFSTPSTVKGYIYKDPMDQLSPEYERCPLVKAEEMCGLSWINDSNEHREDLISKQMYIRFDKDWNNRFGHC